MYSECSSQYGLAGCLQVVAVHWGWPLGSSGGGSSLGWPLGSSGGGNSLGWSLGSAGGGDSSLGMTSGLSRQWQLTGMTSGSSGGNSLGWSLGSAGGGGSSLGMCRSSNCSKAMVTGTNKCNEMLSHYTILLPNSSSLY